MAEETFGRLVTRLRKERHITQAGLAARLHVTDKAVSKWERGAAYPEISTLPRLADELGVRACELLSVIDPRSADAPKDKACAPAPACHNAKRKRRMALRYAGKALLFAAIAILTVMNLYAGYVFDWLMGNTITFSYPYFVLLVLRHLFAACALICAIPLILWIPAVACAPPDSQWPRRVRAEARCRSFLRLGRGRARWAPVAAAGFAALSALCTAGAAAGWIMMFPGEAYWYDWLGAASHTLAAALTIAALFLRRHVLLAARAFLCAAGLCVGAAVFAGAVNTPDFEPGELFLLALVRALELGAPLFLLALCPIAETKRAAFGPVDKPQDSSAAPLRQNVSIL